MVNGPNEEKIKNLRDDLARAEEDNRLERSRNNRLKNGVIAAMMLWTATIGVIGGDWVDPFGLGDQDTIITVQPYPGTIASDPPDDLPTKDCLESVSQAAGVARSEVIIISESVTSNTSTALLLEASTAVGASRWNCVKENRTGHVVMIWPAI